MKHIDALSFPELLLGRTVSFTGTVTRSALSQDLSSNIQRCLNLEHQDLGDLDPELFKHWDLSGNAKMQRTGWQRSQTDWSEHSQTLWIVQCFFPCPIHEVCHQARVPRAREKLETFLEGTVLQTQHSPFSVYVRQWVFGGVSQLSVKLGEI